MFSVTDLTVWILTNRPTGHDTDQTSPTSHQLPGPSALHTTQDSNMDLDTDSDIDPVHQPTSGVDEERELSDPDHDLTTADTDRALSEEQSYRETVCGIRSFLGWTHIPDVHNSSQIFHGLDSYTGCG